MSMQKKVLTCVVIFLFMFSLILTGAPEKKESKWKKFKSKVSQTLNKGKQKVKETYNRVKKNNSSRINQYQQKAREYGNRVGNSVRNSVNTIQSRTENFVRRVTPRIRQKYDSMIRKYGPRIKTQVGTVVERFGDYAAEQWCRVVDKYGDRAGYLVTRICEGSQRAKDYLLNTLEKYGPAAGALLDNACRRFGSERVMRFRHKLARFLPMLASSNNNSFNMARAVDSAIAVYAIYDGYDDYKKEMTCRAIDYLGDNITVQTGRGRISLNRAVGTMVANRVPMLAGTDIANDPSRALTYGLIYHDTGYLLNELKVVKPNGSNQAMSITDAMYAYPPGQTRQQQYLIRAAVSFSKVKNSLDNGSLEMSEAQALVQNLKEAGGTL